MFPILLLGVAALGFLLFSGAGGGPPSTPQPVKGLTLDQINAAVAAALQGEVDPAKLTEFGNALIAAGYASQGAALKQKADLILNPNTPGKGSGTSGDLPSPTPAAPDATYQLLTMAEAANEVPGLKTYLDNSSAFTPDQVGQAFFLIYKRSDGRTIAGTATLSAVDADSSGHLTLADPPDLKGIAAEAGPDAAYIPYDMTNGGKSPWLAMASANYLQQQGLL